MLDVSPPDKARRREILVTFVLAVVIGTGLARLALDTRVVAVEMPEPPMPAALR
jgi:hypothetical protein